MKSLPVNNPFGKIDDELVTSIIARLTREVEDAAALRGISDLPVECKLLVVNSVFLRHLNNFIEFVELPCSSASCLANLSRRINEDGYRAAALAAQNAVRNAVNNDGGRFFIGTYDTTPVLCRACDAGGVAGLPHQPDVCPLIAALELGEAVQ